MFAEMADSDAVVKNGGENGGKDGGKGGGEDGGKGGVEGGSRGGTWDKLLALAAKKVRRPSPDSFTGLGLLKLEDVPQPGSTKADAVATPTDGGNSPQMPVEGVGNAPAVPTSTSGGDIAAPGMEEGGKAPKLDKFTALAKLFGVKVQVENGADAHRWVRYTYESTKVDIVLRQRAHGAVFSRDYDAAKETGVDNTGHVRLWPPEEVMTVHFTKHKDVVRGRRVLELGAGLGLTSIAVAACTDAAYVMATDGNPDTVTSMQENAELNAAQFGKTAFEAKELLWTKGRTKVEDEPEPFEVILCGDCLYFENLHTELIDTTFRLLAPGGTAYFLSPGRAGTLQKFAAAARDVFEVEVKRNYDKDVTMCRFEHEEQESDTSVYQEDFHYPIMVKIQQRK